VLTAATATVHFSAQPETSFCIWNSPNSPRKVLTSSRKADACGTREVLALSQKVDECKPLPHRLVHHREGPAAVVSRRMLKLKATFEGGLSYFSFKRLVPGAFNVVLIGSSCAAVPWRRLDGAGRGWRAGNWGIP
jgi:hypothetical protein